MPSTTCRQRAKSSVSGKPPVLGTVNCYSASDEEIDGGQEQESQQSEHLVMTEVRISTLKLQQCQPIVMCHLFFSHMRI